METPRTHRFELTLHYDGTGFHGWQFQPRHRSVQGDLQTALSRLAARERKVEGSGRTDAGVHATGQVASVDMPATWSAAELRKSLNAILPRDIWIERARLVHDRFHPRYDAVARSYEYRIGTVFECGSPFHRRWCWPLAEPLDISVLAEAAVPVLGRHSFAGFAKSGQPQRGEHCVVSAIGWEPWELGVSMRITANRFLHHMVRYLVGTMVDVALGRRDASEIPSILSGSTSVITSPPAPPEGLFLARVEYPQADPDVTPPEPPTRRSKAPVS